MADTETATFADDTAVLAAHADQVIATHRLQTALLEIQQWLKKCRMKANEKNPPMLPTPLNVFHAHLSNQTVST
jgi:hypothetical protein